MKLVVTGATGFLGRSFVRLAVKAGLEVVAIVRAHKAESHGLPSPVRILIGDFHDAVLLKRELSKTDVLVHLAALGVSGPRNWQPCVDANVRLPLAMLQSLPESLRVVAVGTSLEYQGHGMLPSSNGLKHAPWCDETSVLGGADAYGSTKAAGSLALCGFARERGLPLWYLRMAPLFGPLDAASKLLPSALRAAQHGQIFRMSAGEQVRDWLYVEEAAEAILCAASRPPPDPGTVVNVGTGVGCSARQAVETVFSVCGADHGLIQFGAVPYRRNEAAHLVLNPNRAKSLLGFQARIMLKEGIRCMLS